MSNDGGAARTKLKVAPFALALVVLLFAGHLVFGANRNDLGLAFAVLHLGLLLALTRLSHGQAPPRLPLAWPGLLMGLVFAIGLFSLLPVGPPLAHPLWGYVRALEPAAPATISLDPFATRVQLVELAGFLALFLSAASIAGRREDAEAFGRYLTVAGALYCVWAAIAFASDPRAVFGAPKLYGSDRLTASFFSANSAGTLFACLTLFGLMGVLRPLMRERKRGERLRPSELLKTWPQATLCVLALTCLFLTQSRGGLLSLAAALLIVLALIVWMKSSRQNLTAGFLSAICLVLVAGVAMFALGGQRTAERLAEVNPLNQDRLRIFAAYWPTFRASPWLGYGLGAFPSFNAASMNAENALDLAPLGAVHNVYLQWLLQEGVPGALAMFGAVAMVLAATVRGVARRASQRWLGVACLGMAAVFLVHGLVDFALEEPSLAAFFSAILGLGYGLAQRPASGRSL